MSRVFPVIHEVGNIGIFVQLLKEMNCYLFRVESASIQIYIYHGTSNLNWVDRFLKQI